ncbi:carbohydrate kinase [Linderina pennispora]|uniref:Gluconokinase n=1 Tax=Linderina pennispora TaxID=61395 RepID=A0A1Y1WKR0_9FUNG|nr:carbohydrate kinase [Linderina pennispora]ORX74149.1 carbohydrate kinase [Linderina pennispora]
MLVPESHSVYPVRAVVVMGVSGCGKSTIGRDLAAELGDVPFIDADSLHPQANISKMARGEPLVDSDRWPWLSAVRARIEKEAEGLLSGHDKSLRRVRRIVNDRSGSDQVYREFLSRSDEDRVTHDTVFVHIDVPKQELERRLKERTEHFFDPRLLDSQLETLEVPDPTREASIVLYGNVSEREVAHAAYMSVRNFVTKNSL